MKRAGLGIALVFLGAASWAQFQVHQRAGWEALDWLLTGQSPLPDQIQSQLARETARNTTILGQLLHVRAPSLGLDQTFAAGPDLLANDDVRVASNIKPFVAAAALKLVEAGKLELDAPIAPFLSDPVRKILERSGRPIDQISLRHLLSHTSGIADYGSSRMFQVLAYVPTSLGLAWHWTQQDQIWFAANLTPQGTFGAHFDYSDTNYLLASDMIAKAAGTANAGTALRKLLNWPSIGADEAFWESYEPTPAGTRLVRHFRGAIEDTQLDVSFDQYGGGGLVMSMDDLANAHRAIVRGEVFGNPKKTLALMQATGTAEGSDTYGLGVMALLIEGETCWSHGGRWGTIALHCPRLDLTIARSWGQSNGGPDTQDPKGLTASLIRLAKATDKKTN
jgi:D-alanyl-D-alanine carboxypeptidase